MLDVLKTACLLAGLAGPAFAAEGIIVWNDPGEMAIRMAAFDRQDPARITSLRVLEELTAQSATMTAVTSDGKGIGLCRQERDGNEAPAWLTGYDRKGRQIWKHGAEHYIAALATALPKGMQPYHYDAPSWFTFECADGGAGGASGVLAFDVRFSAGKPDASGMVIGDESRDVTGRLHVDARTGKVVDAALVKKGKSRLTLRQNPRQEEITDPSTGETFMNGMDPAIVLPKGGRGQVLWGDRPFRWKGTPVVKGFDFAWYLPPAG